MTKLKVEDLKRVKDEAKRTVLLREGTARAKVTVYMGTCGITAGAREIMAEFLKLIEERNVDDVIVTSTACAGLCSKEPMIIVEYRFKPPIKYIELTREKVREIFDSHVMKGEPVPKYALGVGSESMV
ncbi:MAG: (2Fe-2S) ferredoxin domain-containing protein [Candidatus Coatesbacteria bacterium]|nr:(2Fe-2S) ferredoxin domain-containing protein [Candidatus Coatesbacteria bacterium]